MAEIFSIGYESGNLDEWDAVQTCGGAALADADALVSDDVETGGYEPAFEYVRPRAG